MYNKDFNGWNAEKKNLEISTPDVLPFHEREIWWCSIGVNLGDEQDGKNLFFERPVLVVKKFNQKLAWVVPLTSRLKTGIYYHGLEHQNRLITVILSQLRLVSIKRLRRLIGKISPYQYFETKHKLLGLLQ